MDSNLILMEGRLVELLPGASSRQQKRLELTGRASRKITAFHGYWDQQHSWWRKSSDLSAKWIIQSRKFGNPFWQFSHVYRIK
jgi:hypothetical protein